MIEMKRERIERKSHRDREDRFGELPPLDPRELPYPFSLRRPTPPSIARSR